MLGSYHVRGAYVGTTGLVRDVTIHGVNPCVNLETIHMDKKLKTVPRSRRWVGSEGG
jgi:hypothetical protein